MSLAEIIGHQKQIKSLRAALATGRLHHAYLFVGPDGIGKKTIAVWLAKAIHCENGRGDPCGRCSACLRIQNGNHADVRIIEALPDKKEITIQQVRELEKELTYRSFCGGWKIAIVDRAGMMNGPAQNALLKTLEEPPQNTVIILIHRNLGELLPTVRSRCLRVAFGPLSSDLITEYLTVQKGKSPQEAKFLAGLAAGSLGTALRLESEGLLNKRREWRDLVASLRSGDYRAAVAAAEGLAGSREEALKFIEWFQSWCRDLLVHAVTQSPADVINVDLLDVLRDRAANAELEQMLAVMGRAAEAAARLQRNVNRRMIVEDLLLRTVERH